MITTTSINQIAVVIGDCDFVGLGRTLHHRQQHRSQDHQKRQQPEKFFHGFHGGKRPIDVGRMASHDLEDSLRALEAASEQGAKRIQELAAAGPILAHRITIAIAVALLSTILATVAIVPALIYRN